MSTTIRVSEETRERASRLAATTGRQLQAVVGDALVAYEKALFWESFADGYERLGDDPAEWESVMAERRGEEPAVRDSSGEPPGGRPATSW